MGKSLTISIAMTTYNGERFLQEQLDSFLWQTRLPDELVVCDDGSSDATLDILHNFARQAPFPVHIHRNEENLGFARNFEKAASLCTKDIIFFSDQDDVWLPHKLEIISYVFSQHPEVGFVFSDAFIVEDDLRSLGYSLWDIYNLNNKSITMYSPELFSLWFFGRCHIHGCVSSIKADLCKELSPLPDQWSHDQWYPFGASFLAGVVSLPLKLQKFRQHCNQTVGTRYLPFIQRILYHWNRSLLNTFKSDRDKIFWMAAYNRISNDKKLYNDNILKLIDEYLDFSNIRYNYNISFMLRKYQLIKEYRAGKYNKYANGRISFLKDMLFY